MTTSDDELRRARCRRFARLAEAFEALACRIGTDALQPQSAAALRVQFEGCVPHIRTTRDAVGHRIALEPVSVLALRRLDGGLAALEAAMLSLPRNDVIPAGVRAAREACALEASARRLLRQALHVLTVGAVTASTLQGAAAAPSCRTTAAACGSDTVPGRYSYTAASLGGPRSGTALDMIARLPGFTLERGGSGRGGEGPGGNVLIDGQRPFGKSQSVEGMLERIRASEVLRIDVVRGRAGAQGPGYSVVANVIMAPASPMSGSVAAELGDSGRLSPKLSMEAGRAAGTAVLEGAADSHPSTELQDRETSGASSQVGGLVVFGRGLRGSVKAPQSPLLTLDESDIASFGAGSLSELLDRLGPQTGSGRGRGDGLPTTLVNGRRISSFREIRDLPPAAIRRVEVLPEEVALRYGYAPDQRVVNFILKDNFKSRPLGAGYRSPARGGTVDSDVQAGQVWIDGQQRLNLTGRINDTTMLTEAERGLVQPRDTIPTVAGDPDPARFRSLVGSSRTYSLNGAWSTGVGEDESAASLTVNGAVTRTDTRSLEGLDTVELVGPDGARQLRSLPDPLTRTTRVTTLENGVTFNRLLSSWQLAATVDGRYSDTRTSVDRPRATSDLVAAAAVGALPVAQPLPALAPGVIDRARAQGAGLTSLVTLAGHPFSLPAGDASVTLKAGSAYNRSASRATGSVRDLVFERRGLSAGVSVDVPLTRRGAGMLGGVGDVSLSLTGGLNHLSDFDTVKDWSAGLNWSPTDKLNVQASYIFNEAAPSLNQLGNPTVLSFNAPVFDFTRGDTALVTIINGGNPDLLRETQRDLKLSANWEAPFFNNSNLVVEYFQNRSKGVTQNFPLLTPEIEAAFPARVVRDLNGQLRSIDRRPVTFSEVKTSRLRYGFNAAGGVRPRGSARQGRWDLSVFHTVELQNIALVAPRGPRLNLLKGDALTDGGIAQHGLEVAGGVFYRGIGLRMNGGWTAPVTVRTSAEQGSTTLRFGSVNNLDVRGFISFDQQQRLVERAPFLRGAVVTFKVENLLDSRQRVRDANGVVPLGYQRDYRNPRGRIIGVEFRKSF